MTEVTANVVLTNIDSAGPELILTPIPGLTSFEIWSEITKVTFYRGLDNQYWQGVEGLPWENSK